MTSNGSRLKWEQYPLPGDEFALLLTNPDQLDKEEGRIRLTQVITSPGINPIPFRAEAASALQSWLKDPGKPMPSNAYGRLSNWFLCQKNDRNAPRGFAAKCFWSLLFRAEPMERLTDTRRNGTVLKDPFRKWWRTQCAWQELD